MKENKPLPPLVQIAAERTTIVTLRKAPKHQRNKEQEKTHSLTPTSSKNRYDNSMPLFVSRSFLFDTKDFFFWQTLHRKYYGNNNRKKKNQTQKQMEISGQTKDFQDAGICSKRVELFFVV